MSKLVSVEKTTSATYEATIKEVSQSHRGRTYIESDRMTSSAQMESADQTARAGGRASTTMIVMT